MFNILVLAELDLVMNLRSYTLNYWVLHFADANTLLESFGIVVVEQIDRDQ